VDAFAFHPRVDRLVVVLPADLVATPPAFLGRYEKPVAIVAGGERRQDSVANGVTAVDGAIDVVLIHDAARPFVDADTITRTIDAAADCGAAIAAIAARDTVKDVDPSRVIRQTIPRERIFLAQTPQAFRRDVLASVLERARGPHEATDEAALAEQAGYAVRVVESSVRNLKITTVDDLHSHEAW